MLFEACGVGSDPGVESGVLGFLMRFGRIWMGLKSGVEKLEFFLNLSFVLNLIQRGVDSINNEMICTMV
jgi:hypothetical protein